MEIVTPQATVIVPELLKRDNYGRWSIFMRHYLQGQDLWDVVQSSKSPTGGNMKEWMKKNAAALHAIKISCGEEMFDQIKGMDSAKDVWDALSNMLERIVFHRENVELPRERRRGPGNLGRSLNGTLTDAISTGNLPQVMKFFGENPNASSARIFENGYTSLHFAVYNRKKRILDYLSYFYRLPKDIEIKDNFGNTALSIAARFGVGKSIAQNLVRADKNLLTIPDNDGKIPVELACSTNHEDMTRYLYRVTPLESLKVDSRFYILQQCVNRKMFDIAFDLLHHFPKLASHNLSSNPLILTLARTLPPFFRGSNLSFWDRLIYDCIRVKANVIKEDKHGSCMERIKDIFQTIEAIFLTCIISPALFLCCALVVRYRFLSYGERIHFSESFKDFRVFLLRLVTFFIVGLPVAISLISLSLIGMLALIMLQILGKLILVPLRILVSVLSRFFAKYIYYGKLMDEYAGEVIHLICQPLSELGQNQFVESRAVEAIFQAIQNGIPNILIEITKDNENILWNSIDPEDLRNIFACAVKYRQEEVAHFLYESVKEEKNMLFTTDQDGNNILHLAAKLAPHHQLGRISGAVLQMQSELRWFKAVEEIVPRAYNEGKNNDNETPLEVFVREHKDLLKEAEEWAKKTTESSTVVGALIITIMFAAAFTVPGGNDQSTGFPIFLHRTPIPFMVFIVSDAISLFAASGSVLMFLGILTSRYANEDFVKSLPIRLIIGLSSLFISIATMTTAFCAALFIMLQGQWGVFIPIALLSSIPVTFFALQFTVLVQIYVLTLGPNIFGKRERSWMSRMTALFAFGMRFLMRWFFQSPATPVN